MATRPPAPPPRGPQFTPPDGGGAGLRQLLKFLAYFVGGIVVLMLVGAGLLFATCSGR
jgi:hypothetical protein